MSQVLLHDSAWLHTSLCTREAIATVRWTVLPHLRYSPDLVPSDLHLFGPLKDALEDIVLWMMRAETWCVWRAAVLQQRVLCGWLTVDNGGDLMWCDVTWLHLMWLDLTLFNVTWLELTWLDLMWFDLTGLDLTWPDFTWLDLTWLDLTWLYLAWLELTWLDVNWCDVMWLDLMWLDLNSLHFTSLCQTSSAGRYRQFTKSCPSLMVSRNNSFSHSVPLQNLRIPFSLVSLGLPLDVFTLCSSLTGNFGLSLTPHFYNMPIPSQPC